MNKAVEEVLEHYGVLGMKWGVRKDRRTGIRKGTPVKGTKAARRDQPSVSPSSSKPARSAENKEKRRLGSHKASQLTNQEIDTFNRRVRLEREFNKLNTRQKSNFRKEVEKLLAEVGREQAKHALNQISRKYVDKGLAALLDEKKK